MIEPTINLPEREQRLRALLAEYHSSVAAGSAPSLDAFISQHPEFAQDLKQILAVRETAADVTESLVSAFAATEAFAGVAPQVSRRQQPDIEPAGCMFGDYELLEKIARGGMGVVYKARQRRLDRLVALKMILDGALASQEDIERFLFEAQAAARLHHPNIVAIYEVGEHDGQHYFSMEYIAGKTLAGLLRDGPLAPDHAARYVQRIAEATHYAHEQGILHRDLKPSNVLIDELDQPRITDFGLAKQMDAGPELTGTGQVLGTASYMAPEQCRGKQRDQVSGPALDVYALGAILYACLSGRPPFQAADSFETMMQVLNQEPVSLRQYNARLPRDLETIAHKCLEKEPLRRYPSAAALAEDLRRFRANEPIVARPVSLPVRAWKWSRRRPAVAALVAVSTLASLMVFATLLVSNVLIARKQAETQDALARETRALTDRTQALQQEKLARDDAEKARDDARRQGELALATLRSVIYDIDAKLKDVPSAHALRRSLLENAMQGLTKISADLEGDRRIDASQVTAHLELGKLFERIGNTDGLGGIKKAKSEFETALTIAQRAADADRDDFDAQRNLAESHLRLGVFLCQIPDLAAGRKHLDAGLTIYLGLVERDPKNLEIQNELGEVYDDLGGLAACQGNLAAARPLYEKSLAIHRRLVAAAPGNAKFQRDLAESCRLMFAHYHRAGDLATARQFGEEGLAVIRPLAEAADAAVSDKRLFAFLSGATGGICADEGDLVAAITYRERACEIHQNLVDADPQNARSQWNLAEACGSLADVWRRLGEREAARKHYGKRIEIERHLSEADPQNKVAALLLANARCEFGRALAEWDELPAARQELEQASAAVRRLVEADPRVPSDWRNDLANIYKNLGGVQWRQGEIAAAQDTFQQALTIFRELSDANPDIALYRYNLAAVYKLLTEASLSLRDIVAAKEHNRLEMAIMRRLVEAAPTDAVNKFQLAQSHLRLAFILESIGDYRAAAAEGAAGLEIVKSLDAAGKTIVTGQLKEVESILTKLQREQRAFEDREFVLKSPEKERLELLGHRVAGLAVAGRFAEAVEAAGLMRDFRPRTSDSHYAAACAYCRIVQAMLGEAAGGPLSCEDDIVRRRYLDEALKLLTTAEPWGHYKVDKLKSDSQLNPLRETPEFQAIVQRSEAKQAKKP